MIKNILAEIVTCKKEEVEEKKNSVPLNKLQDNVLYHREPISLSKKIKEQNTPFLIAEFKRKSPSKGIISQDKSSEIIAKIYEQSGVSAISVLTDFHFFGGTNEDLTKVRNIVSIPILRKEFIIDSYQIVEAKAIGADIILLIAAILTKTQIADFTNYAHSLGLEVLVEIHDEKEVDMIYDGVDFVGINNRNLRNFHVDIHQSKHLVSNIPKHFIRIAESGIQNPDDAHLLFQAGFHGILVGEYLMKSTNITETITSLLRHSYQ